MNSSVEIVHINDRIFRPPPGCDLHRLIGWCTVPLARKTSLSLTKRYPSRFFFIEWYHFTLSEVNDNLRQDFKKDPTIPFFVSVFFFFLSGAFTPSAPTDTLLFVVLFDP